MTNHHRIDYIELGATDMAASKAFYTAAFGWPFTDYGPDYASFADGRLNGGVTTQLPAGPGGPLVVLYSDDLEASRDDVTKAGGKIVKDIFTFPGGRRFEFTDPAKNKLAVWTDDAAKMND